MIVLAREQGQLIFNPIKSRDQYHMALTGYDGGLLKLLPMIPWLRPEKQIRYGLEADLPASMAPIQTELIPELPAAALTINPYADHATRQVAQWRLKNKVRPWVEGMDGAIYDEFENPIYTNIKAFIRRFGEQLIKEIILRTVTVTTSHIGSIVANLSSWNNSAPAFTEGYQAGVLTQQTVAAGGRVWGATGDATLLDELLWKIRSGGQRIIIVPQRFIKAMKQSYYANTDHIPEVYFLPESQFSPVPDQAGGKGFKFIEWQGALIVPIADEYWAATGHNVAGAVGAANYDIYALAMPTNPDDGCYLAINEETGQDETTKEIGTAPAVGDSIGFTDGLRLWYKGYVNTAAGSARAKVYELAMKVAFAITHPQAAARLTGVTD